MRAEALTRTLGGRWHGRYGTARCPAHDDGNPSLSIKDGEDGRLLLFCHAGCDFRSVADALLARSVGDPWEAPSSAPGRKEAKSGLPVGDLVSLILKQTQPIDGSLAERYLRARSIMGPLPATLRFHRRLRHPTGKYFPAMVGQVEHVQSGTVGLHRTYLDAITADKVTAQPNKAMLGPCKGGAVRLVSGSAGLVVCEGIETALSLAASAEEGFAVWAALSTSGIAGLALPQRSDHGGRLLIGTDGDKPGRMAGVILADRATSLGWQVEVVSAPDGQDFNDLMRSGNDG